MEVHCAQPAHACNGERVSASLAVHEKLCGSQLLSGFKAPIHLRQWMNECLLYEDISFLRRERAQTNKPLETGKLQLLNTYIFSF